MVDKDKYDQLLEDQQHIYEEIKNIQEAKNMLTQQLQIVSQQEKGNESKVGELNQSLLNLSHQLEKSNKERDFANMELKSVQNIMKQKDSFIKELQQEKQSEVEKVKESQKSFDKFRNDREKLLEDNTTLIKENKKLKDNILELNDFIKSQKEQFETEKSKDQELIHYLQTSNSVQSSVQKVQNPNMFDSRAYSGSGDFHHISNKTADFHQESDHKENTSLNSIKNISPSFCPEVPTYGKISKNRSKSRTRGI